MNPTAAWLGAMLAAAAAPQDMTAVPDGAKATVSLREYPDARVPDAARGWYHSVAGVVATGDGLVATYRRSDAHMATDTSIMVARSADGGRTWTDHRPISHLSAEKDGAVWVAPQLSRLRDGRLVIICDRGERRTGQDWPMLSDWQKPGRGMSNHLFWSRDGGRTWDGPHRIDDVGGEPGYVVDLSDGTLVFTRTESRPAEGVWDPPKPWGATYYRAVAVFSDDGGKTWPRTSIIADSPLHGDCEVGIVETAPGRLLAATRIGFGGGALGQPSRLIRSDDSGRTWKDAHLAPFYGQRTVIGRLRCGRLLVTFRNRWGTLASYAFAFDPDEEWTYQPNSFIWDESRCTVADGAMTIDSGEGAAGAVAFCLYPAQGPDSRVEIEAELRVERAGPGGCAVGAGCWVCLEPKRVCLADRPKEGFDLDATAWHRYRIVRENGRIAIEVDGQARLTAPTAGLETRLVGFGNRFTGFAGFRENRARSQWRSVRAKVANRGDHSIDWRWDARDGLPDRFRRERMVRLDRAAESGYSGWAQAADGTVVVLDYTNEDLRGAGQGGPMPWVRAYRLPEALLAHDAPSRSP